MAARSRAGRLAATLAALFAALPLSAATFRAVPEGVPVQLSLPFAAAPAAAVTALTAPVLAPSVLPTAAAPMAAPAAAFAAPAAAPIAAASLAAPAGAVRAADWASMPPAVAKAFRAGDAREFWEACRRAGFEPPPSDDAQQSLLAEGWARATADAAYERAWVPAAPVAAAAAPAKTRPTKMDYEVFGARLSRGVPDPGVFAQTETKRGILRDSGYTHLRGPGGARIPIEEAGAARIGLAFNETLKTWRRRAAR